MKKLLFVLIFIFFTGTAAAADIRYDGKAVWVNSISIKELEKLFAEYDYIDYAVIRGEYPRIYLQKLPVDWLSTADSESKHRMFIRIMLPLVLKINEEILTERDEIKRIKAKFSEDIALSDEELRFLEIKAEKYDVFTRLSGDARTGVLLNRLLTKIDALPPSIMIAAAAVYTDWGTSRLAIEANSLFMDEIWYQDKGIKPRDDAAAEYRYAIYNTLEDCIRARALLLNSHVNYEYFRESRRIAESMNRPAYGQQMAVKMLNDSNYNNIAGLIDYTFSYYDLQKADYFPRLRDVMTPPNLSEE